jgi:hypothetical protein
MTTATPTRPTTTATTPAPRACWWVIRPEEMPDGRLFGALAVRMGRLRPDFYRVVRDDSGEFGSDWSVAKEQADGTFAEPYTVHLPPAGRLTRPTCSCPGHLYRRDDAAICRHAASLTAALRSL